MKEFRVDLGKDSNTFQLVVLGDMHIGDELCDLDLIKSTINYIKNTNDCYAILNGDLINNALKCSKSDSYKESMTIEEEQDLLIDLLYPIKDKILVIATGNHEYRTSLIAGINPLKAVAYALGLKDKLVENSYLLDISYGKVAGVKDCSNRYVVYGIHGGFGGGRHAGATANALQDMALVVSNADLYIHSHTHTQVTYSDVVFMYDKQKHRMMEHQRTFHNANSFLKYGGYAEQKGYRPSDKSPTSIVVKSLNVRKPKRGMKTITSVVKF